ncbi:MAG TPA: phage portal protein, partial [Candidatus Angelobacter sp.]
AIKPAPAKRSFVYEGAAGNRLTSDWLAPILSPDQELRGNLRLLRGRGREMARNNPTAKHFLNLLGTNVIGHRGVRYRARVRNNDGTLNTSINRKIENAWDEWCQLGNCTVDGKMSFRHVQELALRTTAMDGEGFTRKVRGFDNKWGFALQLIDADQVDHLFTRAPRNASTISSLTSASNENTNEVRLGVEVNGWGRPTAYYINPGHPSDFGGSLLRQRVPADQIVHNFEPYRPNQTRGITWFHPVMIASKMLHGYIESELVASRVTSAKPGWFYYSDPAAYEAPNPDQPLRMEANPGVYEKLPPGLRFEANPADHPANAFESFTKTNLRLEACGLGVSYNALANDLVGVNYSSLRSGLLIERDRWSVLQQWFIESFMRPIFNDWLAMALLSGALKLDSRDPARFCEGVFLPRGWQWVDPLKDSQAAIIDIAAALNSPARVVAERGDDLEEIYEEIAEAEKLAKKYGIVMNLNPPARPSTEKNPGEVQDEETEEGMESSKEKDAEAGKKGSVVPIARAAGGPQWHFHIGHAPEDRETLQ